MAAQDYHRSGAAGGISGDRVLPVRAGLLQEAEAFCTYPPSHQVFVGRQSAGMPVTEVITSHVRPDRDNDYLAWQREMDGIVSRAEGFLRTELFPPALGQSDWTIVIRFETTEHLDAWKESESRRRMLASAAPFAESFQHRRVAFGCGAWFAGRANTGDLAGPPASLEAGVDRAVTALSHMR